MNISPIDPISHAWNHMVRILFKPFAFKKWLALGFCAFLAQCGEQGGSNWSNVGNNSSGADGFNRTRDWIDSNFEIFLIILIASVTIIVALSLLVTWLSSRGKFMFIDGIVKNRGAIKEPWSEYRKEGNSLFFFSVVVGIALFVTFGLIIGLSVFIGAPDIQNEKLSYLGVIALSVGGTLLLLYILFCLFLSFFIDVFLIPTMYLKRVGAIEGWKSSWNTLLKGHVGSFILLVLMMIVLGLASMTVVFFGICITCCIGALPYISSILFLPITVFFVCYSLCYIQQFGREWVFFKNLCRFCAYDLEGLEDGHTCPECGR